MISGGRKVVYKNLQQIIKSAPHNLDDKENNHQSPNHRSYKKYGSNFSSSSQALQPKSDFYINSSSPSKDNQVLHMLSSNAVKKFPSNMIAQSVDKRSTLKQSNPRTNQNYRLETYQSCSNPVTYKSNQKTKTEIHRSLSKHSLKSTPKLVQMNKFSTQIAENLKTEDLQVHQKVAIFFNDRTSLSNHKLTTNIQHHSYNDTPKQKMGRQNNVKSTNNFNEYFNQIDALYTDLQDFIYMSKEKVVSNIRNQIALAKDRDQKFKNSTNDKIQSYIKQLVNTTKTVKRISSETINKQIMSENLKLDLIKKFKTQCRSQQNSNQIRFITKKQFLNKNFDKQEESIQNLWANNMKIRNSRKKECLKEYLKEQQKRPSIYQMVLQQNHKRFITKRN